MNTSLQIPINGLRSLVISYGALSTGSRVDIYTAIANLLAANLNVATALRKIYHSATRHDSDGNFLSGLTPKKLALKQWLARVESGSTLSDSLSSWIPADEFNLLLAGENSATTDEDLVKTFENMVELAGQKKMLQGVLIKALTYPIILGVGMLYFMHHFATETLPSITSSIDPEKLKGLGLVTASELVREHWVLMGMGVLILIGIVVFSVPNYSGKLRRYLDLLPPWSMYRLSVGASTIKCFNLLTQANMQEKTALTLLQQNASPYLRSRLNGVVVQVASGKSFGAGLDSTGYEFPDQNFIDIAIEIPENANYARNLNKAIKRWEKDMLAKLDLQAELINRMCIIFVGLILVGIVKGYFDVMNVIQ